MFDRMRAERKNEKIKFAGATLSLMLIATLLFIKNYELNNNPSSIPVINMLASLLSVFAVLALGIKGVKDYVASDNARAVIEVREEARRLSRGA
jgi:ABC-type transport system involved in cytochrome c biogenesis permease subunit